MPLATQNAQAFHFLADMLETVEIGLVVLDLDFKVQLWNGFMENHSGLNSTAVREQNIFSLFPDLPQEWLKQKIETVITPGPTHDRFLSNLYLLSVASRS